MELELTIGQHVHYDVYPMGFNKPAIVEANTPWTEMEGDLVLRAIGEWRDYLEESEFWPYADPELVHAVRACDDAQCPYRAGDAVTPRERIRHAAVDRILRTYTDKDRAWAVAQLERCLCNADAPASSDDYEQFVDAILNVEFAV